MATHTHTHTKTRVQPIKRWRDLHEFMHELERTKSSAVSHEEKFLFHNINTRYVIAKCVCVCTSQNYTELSLRSFVMFYFILFSIHFASAVVYDINSHVPFVSWAVSCRSFFLLLRIFGTEPVNYNAWFTYLLDAVACLLWKSIPLPEVAA